MQVFPEVVDCWLMTGNRDDLLRVATEGLAGFEVFLTGRPTQLPSVSIIKSSIPMYRQTCGQTVPALCRSRCGAVSAVAAARSARSAVRAADRSGAVVRRCRHRSRR